MANYYVRSGAAGAGTGADWANAFTTVAAALSGRTNADVLWVANDHDYNTTSAITWTCPTSPGLRILCVNTNVTEPPTGLATTAIERIGAASQAFTINGFAYIYGMKIQGGTNSSSVANIHLHNATTPGGLFLESCVLDGRATGGGGGIIFLGAASNDLNDDCSVELKNCTFKFGNTGAGITPRGGRHTIRGMTIDGAGTAPTTLFSTPNSCMNSIVKVESSDLSGETFTNLVNVAGASTVDFTFRYCKVPASVTVVTGTNPSMGGTRVRMHDCDSADTNFRLAEHDYAGSVVNETTIVRTGGASDGTTTVSDKMSTSASAKYPDVLLYGPEISAWNDTTGSSKTVTVEIVHDSQGAGTGSRFQDDEIWLDVQYLGTSGVPLGTVITDAKTDVFATAADQTDSSETWTTTGLTTPVKQKLSVTFTPQEKGTIIARVCMAKASKVCYVDPELTIS